MEELKITKEYLEELVKFSGKSLCGKLLKRFEVLDDKNSIKAEAKELIYESYRNFRDLFLAYQEGREIQQFKFNNKRD